jgi:hypothetical protein
MDFADGISSHNTCKRLASSSVLRTEIPVALPPGRFRLRRIDSGRDQTR